MLNKILLASPPAAGKTADVVEVHREVQPKHETAAIVTKLEERGRSPMLLFGNVAGCQHLVITNVCGSMGRLAMALGCSIALDDFGTGYSSLSYLHRFPIDTLKVDRSFVMNIDELGEDHAIVETIITLGHHLGMDVIAEGIETAGQAQKLKLLRCEYGQGYYFAKPLPAAQAEALLKKEMRWLESA